MSVEWLRLGDVLAMNRTPTNVDPGATYRPVGVRAFGRGIFDYAPTKGADLSKVRYFDLPAASLVISNIKGWEGAVAATEATEEGRIASSRFLTYQPSAEVDPRYVLHWLLSDGGLEVLRRCSPGSADRNRTLSRKGLEASLLPLPPIDEQRSIAAHLDGVAAVTQQGSPDLSVEAVIHALVRSAIDAPRARLGDVMVMDRQFIELDERKSYRAIGIRGFGRGLIKYPAVPREQLSKLRYFDVKPFRLLVSNIKAWEGAVAQTTADDLALVGSNRFLQYEVSSPHVSLDWVLAYLSSPEGTAAMSAASPGSADRNRTLSIRSFESLEIPVPSAAVQGHVAELREIGRRFAKLTHRKSALIQALLPAARNEIFTAMR